MSKRLFGEGFFHGGTNLLVEDSLVLVVGIAVVVARGQVPEHDDEVVGRHISWDGLERFAVGGVDDEGGVSLDSLSKLVAAVPAVGGAIGCAEPNEGVSTFGVEFYRVVVLVENFGDGGVGEGLAVHLLTVATPGGVEVDEIEFLAYLGFGGLLNGMPFHLRLGV